MKTRILFLCLWIIALNSSGQDIVYQQHCVDSLLDQIAQCKDDTNKVHLWLRAAYHEYWIHPEEAYDFSANASVLSQKLSYEKGIAMSFMSYGNQHEYSKKYDDALAMYDRARFYAEKNKLYTLTHDAFISLINMHFYKGQYVYALDLCLRGLQLAQDSSDLQREAMYTNLSGFIYRNMKQSEDEEHAFVEYSRLAHLSGDSLLVASACVEFAQVMMEKQYYDSAEVYLDTAYQLYSGHYETHRRAFIHYLRAKIHLETGVREAALTNAKTAIALSKSAPSDEFDVARYYTIAGKAFFQMRIFDEALNYLDTALRISRRIQHQENIRDAYQLMAYTFDLKGDKDSAYRYLSLYSALQDSLLNAENLRTIAEMKAKYFLEQRDAEIEKLEADAVLKAENDRQNIVIRNLAIGLIFVVLITGLLLFNRYRLKQKNKLQLTINKQQNELFQAVISAQERERQRIAGDLHDGLGSLLSSAKLQLNLMKEEGAQKHFDAAYELIDRSSQDLRNISHAIMPAPLTKLGLAAALQNVVRGFETNDHVKFRFHSHGMEKRLNNEAELALYNVAMELLNNILKHSKAKNATVQLIRHESHVNLTVEDDGAGFDTVKATSGIGLNNIRSRIAYLKGTVEIDSQPGKGTTVSIDVPVL
jgi:two-component system, NarL family, sensor kinase